MSDPSRRRFLAALGPLGATALGGAQAAPSSAPAPSRMKIGYAAITWGGRDDEAIDDIAAVGFKAIQLRASVLNAYAGRPAALRRRLRDRHLTFAVLSSGNLRAGSAGATNQTALHTA